MFGGINVIILAGSLGLKSKNCYYWKRKNIKFREKLV